MSNQDNVEQSSPLKPTEIKKHLSALVTGLLGAIDERSKSTELYNELIKVGKIFNNPSSFFFAFTYDQNNAIKSALSTVKELDSGCREQYCNIFLNFNFYESHISQLVSTYTGSFGCTDKSRAIVIRFLLYLRTGYKGAWEANEKGCYWLPTFGTQDDWYDFVESLHDLYYGRPYKYLLNYKKLKKLGIKERARLKSLPEDEE